MAFYPCRQQSMKMTQDIQEIKENINDINSNLDGLSYDENAGGKNLLDLPNPYSITGTYSKSITVKVKKNTNYTLSVGSVTSSVYQGIIVRPINSDTTIISKYGAPYIMPFNSGDNESIRILFYSGNATSGTSVYSDVQLEYGTQATEYEPYIPSVKILAEENAHQSIEMLDAKMLGWTVPKECPIQNEVSGNQFIQKVGRVKIGNLTIGDTFADENCIRIAVPTNASKEWSNVLYIDGYISVNPEDYSGWVNNRSDFSVGYLSTYEYVIIKDSSCGSKSGFESKLNEKYLYYKLNTPITMTIDGNESATKVNDSLTNIGKCKNLLKTNDGIITKNGLTITFKDGMFTVNGTSETTDISIVIGSAKVKKGVTYKLLGCPSGGGWQTYSLRATGIYDIGEGTCFTIDSDTELFFTLYVTTGNLSINNVIFKPIVTTNLTATIDDFVQYTGDGDTLTDDVAELKNDFVVLEDILQSGKVYTLPVGFSDDDYYIAFVNYIDINNNLAYGCPANCAIYIDNSTKKLTCYLGDQTLENHNVYIGLKKKQIAN